jgi:hypothetical protein
MDGFEELIVLIERLDGVVRRTEYNTVSEGNNEKNGRIEE